MLQERKIRASQNGRWARIQVLVAFIAALAAGSAQAATGTWTGGNGGTWDTSNTNWSGVGNPAWDAANGQLNVAEFSTVGDAASISGVVRPGAISFAESASVDGFYIDPISGNYIGFTSLSSALTIDAAATKTGTINADIRATEANGNAGNILHKTGSGKVLLTGTVELVNDATHENKASFFTVNGGGELEVTGFFRSIQADLTATARQYPASSIGNTSGNNTLSVSLTGQLWTNDLTIGDAGNNNNAVILTAPGTSLAPTLRVWGQDSQLNMRSSGNSLQVLGGAYVATAGGGTATWTIGNSAGNNTNSILVSGAGSTLSSGTNTSIIIGGAGDGNSLTIDSGGAVIFRRLEIGTNGGDNNFVLISGGTSSFNGSGGQQVFSIGSTRALTAAAAVPSTGNYLRIEAGGTFIMDAGHNRGYNIGGIAGADNNYVVVTGSGSLFTMQQAMPLAIGGGAGNNNNANNVTNSTAAGNHLDIFDGARSNQRTLYVMGVNSAVNLGDGSGISELELGHSANGGADVYGAGLILANSDSRLNINNGRIIAGATAGGATGNNLVTGYMGSLTNTGPAFTGPGMIDLLGTGYVQVNNADTRLISVQITGVGDLHKEGTGLLHLTQSNSYGGDTIVSGGTLELDFAFLSDTADVQIASGALMNLTHGLTDTIAALALNNIGMTPGLTYGSTSSGANVQNDTYFSGTGRLLVTAVFSGGGPAIPAPAALPAGLAILGLCALRRRA